MYKNSRLLIAWAVILFFATLIFQFLHECGHGFGSSLEGYHVSTGFDKVGDVGKRPSDHDFRLNKTIQGRWNLSDFLGPMINWIFAIFFTAIFLRQRTVSCVAVLFGSGAAINALIRLVPMLMFFGSAFLGRFVLEDEVALGLSAIQGIKFPMSYLNFKILASTKSSLFLVEPKIYYWPVISLIISIVCFIPTYRRLSQLIRQHLTSRISQWFFMLVPFLILPLAFICAKKLDSLIRLNW